MLLQTLAHIGIINDALPADIQPSCVPTGEGLYEGLTGLTGVAAEQSVVKPLQETKTLFPNRDH